MKTYPTANADELNAILHGAAVVALEGPFRRAYLRICGSDATRWLNGMVSNSVKDLTPGTGCYTFLLNAQGRIEGDAYIYRECRTPVSFVLTTTSNQIEHIHALLDRFIIMDDVEMEPLETSDDTVLLTGPRAADVWACWAGEEASRLELQPLRHADGAIRGAFVDILPAVDGLQIEFAPERPASEIVEELTGCGATPISLAALDAYRVLSGQPRYGVDIRNTETAKDLPQETDQAQALHFNKGCYLGQEIVERIRSRGQVHRLLTKFTLTGELPVELPAALSVNGKAAGEITSVAEIAGEGIALGYARRELLDANNTFNYAGGMAHKRI